MIKVRLWMNTVGPHGKRVNDYSPKIYGKYMKQKEGNSQSSKQEILLWIWKYEKKKQVVLLTQSFAC